MRIFKEIAFVFVYYFLASLIDQIFMMLTGNIYVSFILTALCICMTSVSLRSIRITESNYTQEQRDKYSQSFNSKFKKIVGSLDFKVEFVIGTLVCLLFALVPQIASGACYGLGVIAENPLYALPLIPLFLITNFIVWYAAYHKSFKKKKY